MFRLTRLFRSMFKMRGDRARFCLDGVMLRVDDDGLQHVQFTDGRRLVAATLKRPDEDDAEPSGGGVFDAVAIDAMLRMVRPNEAVRVDLRAADDKSAPVSFKMGDANLTGTIGRLHGTFPPTDAVWPNTPPVVAFGVNADYLIEALHAAKAASNGRKVDVLITCYGPKMPTLLEPVGELAEGVESFHVLIMPVSKHGDDPLTSRPTPRMNRVKPVEAVAPQTTVAEPVAP